jgi:hypothetical protein
MAVQRERVLFGAPPVRDIVMLVSSDDASQHAIETGVGPGLGAMSISSASETADE